VLAWKLATGGSEVSIGTFGHFVAKLIKGIPVPFKRVRDLIGSFGVAKFENGIVVECPVLGTFVLAPNLLSFDTEDFHANSARRWDIVRDQLWCE